MRRTVAPAASLKGEITVPGDKSISHRAVMLNALAQGEARVTNLANGEDVQRTITIMRLLGVKIEPTPNANEHRIVGAGGINNLQQPDEPLYAGNSGTTMRLLSGVLAALPFPTTIQGDRSLNSRPMKRILDPLRRMGAQVEADAGDTAPLHFKGTTGLRGINYEMPLASAQVKSCLLLAGLAAKGTTRITEKTPTRDHTERMLQAMGADITVRDHAVTAAAGPLNAVDVDVPGDISAAMFWLVGAVIHPDGDILCRNVGINPRRTGALDLLKRMGARIELHNQRTSASGEPVADIRARSSKLKAIHIRPGDVAGAIDEIPIISLAAAFATGKTTVVGAAELRAKESDRIATTCEWLTQGGITADTFGLERPPDNFHIEGKGEFKGGRIFNSHTDHRVAMCLGIASTVATNPIRIDNAEAADTSYPNFWHDLRRVAPAGDLCEPGTEASPAR